MLEADAIEINAAGASASLNLNFPQVSWAFLQSVYGWAALQYQAWARGEIFVSADKSQTVIIYTDHVLEFWIDDSHYFGGDFYAFRRAPLVITLEPGSHRIDLRLVRDVRAMGGVGEPSINAKLDVRLASGSLELAKDGVLMADVVNGTLASEWASVIVRNSDFRAIEILGIECSDVSFILFINLSYVKPRELPSQHPYKLMKVRNRLASISGMLINSSYLPVRHGQYPFVFLCVDSIHSSKLISGTSQTILQGTHPP